MVYTVTVGSVACLFALVEVFLFTFWGVGEEGVWVCVCVFVDGWEEDEV